MPNKFLTRILMILFILICIIDYLWLTGCVNRTYRVEIYNFGGVVTFRADVLAEVPHSTNVKPEIDIPLLKH